MEPETLSQEIEERRLRDLELTNRIERLEELIAELCARAGIRDGEA